MQFDNQTTRNVADIVARILAGESVKQEPKMLEEELVGNQHKIDANKNNKIDAHDFKLLRKKKKVEEETEEIDETNHARSATKSEYQKSLKTLEKMPEFGAMSKSLKRRDQDAEYDKRKQDEFKKSLKKEETELTESHFKVGDEVICKASGMEGEVVKIDEPQTGKYYTVKQENGKMVKYAPNELKKEEEDEDEEDDEDENKMKSEEVDNKKKDDTPSTSNSVKKPVRNSDGTIQSPISRARELAQQGLKKAMSKEETEIDEAMFPGTKEYEKKFGQSPQQKLKKKGDTVPTSQGDMTKTDKGIAHRRRFTEMLESYTEGGLKYIATLVQEEPDNEEYTKEVEDQKAKMDGKKKGGDVAKASVQAVKNEEVEELDELSKSTLASYAKKASHEARMKHGIGKDFERISKSSRKPEYKQGAKEWEDKYKSDARRREAGVGKAIDRLAKEEVELDEAINHLQMAKHHQAIAKEHDRISHKAAGNDEDDLSIAHSDQSEVHQDAAKAHLQAHKTGNPKDVASAKKATKQSLQNDTTRIMRSNYTHFYNVTKGRKSSTGEDDHKDYNYSELRSGADAIKKGLNEETEIQVINADIANGVEQIDIEEGAKETATRARELADKLSKKDPKKSQFYRNMANQALTRINKGVGIGSYRPGDIEGGGNKSLRRQGIEPAGKSPVFPFRKEEVEIEERSLTEPEMKKKEEIVMSMKKKCLVSKSDMVTVQKK
jgi:hypothetical protein